MNNNININTSNLIIAQKDRVIDDNTLEYEVFLPHCSNCKKELIKDNYGNYLCTNTNCILRFKRISSNK